MRKLKPAATTRASLSILTQIALETGSLALLGSGDFFFIRRLSSIASSDSLVV